MTNILKFEGLLHEDLTMLNEGKKVHQTISMLASPNGGLRVKTTAQGAKALATVSSFECQPEAYDRLFGWTEFDDYESLQAGMDPMTFDDLLEAGESMDTDEDPPTSPSQLAETMNRVLP